MEERVLSFGKFSAFAVGHQGGLAPHFGLQKLLVLELHTTTRKPTMMQKGIITINPTCLTKVTFIGSISKVLNTKSLVVLSSNTRFNIQSLLF